MSEIPAGDELLELAFLALEHGIGSVQESGGPLTPFAMIETAEWSDLARFVAETLEEGQELARRHVRDAEGAVRVAIAFDGFVTIEGERSDAILVEAQERGRPKSVILAQRYRPGGRLRKFSTIGNAAYLGEGDTLL